GLRGIPATLCGESARSASTQVSFSSIFLFGVTKAWLNLELSILGGWARRARETTRRWSAPASTCGNRLLVLTWSFHIWTFNYDALRMITAAQLRAARALAR